jgi:acetoin utilization deacetylase AcuC-like enzyme
MTAIASSLVPPDPIPLVFDPIYSQLDLPVRHRFPIEKYQGIKDALLLNGVADSVFNKPTPLTSSQLERVYDPSYISQLVSGTLDRKAMRRIGFQPN